MIDTLAISWEDSGKSPTSSVANGIKKIVAKRLSKFGYRGIWRVLPIQKRREASCDRDGFKYKRLDEAGTISFFRAFCRPKDPETCWEVAIYPPVDYDIGDVDINLSGNKPKPKKTKAKKSEKAQPHKIAVGQVLKGNITGKTDYGLLVCIPDGGLQGLVPIEHLGKKYDVDNLNAYKIGQSLKVQVTELEPNVKFSPESAKHVTETESVDDTFNGSADSDGMLRLKGYSTSIERVRQLFLWLEKLARDYYPDPIPRAKAIDELELELLVKYDDATQAQRRVVATLTRALTHKGWVYVTGGRDFGITEDGWIEFGGEPQRGGDAPPITTTIVQEPEPEIEPEPEPEPEIEEPEEEPEEETDLELEEVLQEVVEESIAPPQASLANWVHKVNRSLSIGAEIDKLQAEKCEIEEWLKAHHDEIDSIAKRLV